MENSPSKHKENARIAVLILNWKAIDVTLECLASVATSRNVIPEVFLLDNGTNRTAFEKLRSKLNDKNLKIHLFASYQNLGFAGGVNYLMGHVDIENFAGIFLLNNDAKITRDTLYTLLEESRKKDMQMLGPKNQLSKTGPSRRWPWWLFGVRFAHKYNAKKNAWPTCYIDGSELFITSPLVKKIINQRGSLFENRYFLYGEDTELGLFAQKMRIQPYITSKAKLIHKRGSYGTEIRRMLTYYYTTRNRIYLCRDYLGSILKPLFHIYYPLSRLFIICYRWLKGEHKLVLAIIEGLKDGYSEKYGKWSKHP